MSFLLTLRISSVVPFLSMCVFAALHHESSESSADDLSGHARLQQEKGNGGLESKVFRATEETKAADQLLGRSSVTGRLIVTRIRNQWLLEDKQESALIVTWNANFRLV